MFKKTILNKEIKGNVAEILELQNKQKMCIEDFVC